RVAADPDLTAALLVRARRQRTLVAYESSVEVEDIAGARREIVDCAGKESARRIRAGRVESAAINPDVATASRVRPAGRRSSAAASELPILVRDVAAALPDVGERRRVPVAAAGLTTRVQHSVIDPDVAAAPGIGAAGRSSSAIASELAVLVGDISAALRDVGEKARDPVAAAVLAACVQRAAVEPYVTTTPGIGAAGRSRAAIASELAILVGDVADALVIVGQRCV